MTEETSLSRPPSTCPTKPPEPLTWTRLAAATPGSAARSRRCCRRTIQRGEFPRTPGGRAVPRRRHRAHRSRRQRPSSRTPDATVATRGCRACRQQDREDESDDLTFLHPVHPARLARPARALRGAPGARPGRLRHRLPGLRRDAAARGRGQGAWPRRSPPRRPPASGFCARPGRRRRSGTRTWCRSTRSASSRCPTW